VEEDVAAKPLDVEMLRRVLEQLRIQRAVAGEVEETPSGLDSWPPAFQEDRAR
jgi:hypothetical protein